MTLALSSSQGEGRSVREVNSSRLPARAKSFEGAVEGTHSKTGDAMPSPVTFTMPVPPSVNEIYKNVRGKGRVKTRLYEDFILMGIAAIRRQAVHHIPGRVLAIFGVERMSLAADIDNRLKAMLDAIVKASIIEDDRFVTGIAVSWLPKANGMAHVMLLPVQKLDLTFHPSHDGASGGWFIAAPSTEEGEPCNGDFSL